MTKSTDKGKEKRAGVSIEWHIDNKKRSWTGLIFFVAVILLMAFLVYMFYFYPYTQNFQPVKCPSGAFLCDDYCVGSKEQCPSYTTTSTTIGEVYINKTLANTTPTTIWRACKDGKKEVTITCDCAKNTTTPCMAYCFECVDKDASYVYNRDKREFEWIVTTTIKPTTTTKSFCSDKPDGWYCKSNVKLECIDGTNPMTKDCDEIQIRTCDINTYTAGSKPTCYIELVDGVCRETQGPGKAECYRE